MKRLLVLTIAFTFVFVGFFNLSTANAYDAGCYGTNLYSNLTGLPCNSGQSYYPGYPGQTYIPGCDGYTQYSTITGQPCSNSSSLTISPTREVVFGSRGEDVRMLQEALQRKGFFNGRVDGVFGPLTLRAVTNYQAAVGLPVTGNGDFQTLSKLNLNLPIGTVPPITPPNCYPGLVIYPCYTGGQAPTISQVSGPQYLNVNQDGTWTIVASSPMGGNLTYSVNWGDQAVFAQAPQSSFIYPQQSSTFTHRYQYPGTYTATFTVTNSQGQTAQSSITVNVGGYGSGQYAPVIYSMTPVSGPVGTQVNIYGNHLSGSTVTFSNYPLQLTSSSDTFISFVVPANLNYCPPIQGIACTLVFIPPTPGNHTVKVSNTSGSESRNFTVTGGGSGVSAPYISSITPNIGPKGSQVTVYGSNFSYTGNTVTFGSTTIPNVSSYNGTTLTFMVPFNGNTYPYQNVNVWVRNQNNSVSNTVNFTVTN